MSLISKWAAALANLFTLAAAAKAYPLSDGIVRVIRFCQAVPLFMKLFLMIYNLAPDSDQNCHLMCYVIDHFCPGSLLRLRPGRCLADDICTFPPCHLWSCLTFKVLLMWQNIHSLFWKPLHFCEKGICPSNITKPRKFIATISSGFLINVCQLNNA